MTMERRGFFKSIAGLFVVVAVDPVALLKPAELGSPLGGIYVNTAVIEAAKARNMATIQADMQRLTEFMHRELVRELDQAGLRFAEPVNMLTSGFVLSRLSEIFPWQFGVDFELDHEAIGRLTDEQICARYVRPAVMQMAYEIERQGATRFAQLPLPLGIDAAARVTGDGVSIRGLRAYDVRGAWMEIDGEVVSLPNTFIHRFDVLFG